MGEASAFIKKNKPIEIKLQKDRPLSANSENHDIETVFLFDIMLILMVHQTGRQKEILFLLIHSIILDLTL